VCPRNVDISWGSRGFFVESILQASFSTESVSRTSEVHSTLVTSDNVALSGTCTVCVLYGHVRRRRILVAGLPASRSWLYFTGESHAAQNPQF